MISLLWSTTILTSRNTIVFLANILQGTFSRDILIYLRKKQTRFLQSISNQFEEVHTNGRNGWEEEREASDSSTNSIDPSIRLTLKEDAKLLRHRGGFLHPGRGMLQLCPSLALPSSPFPLPSCLSNANYHTSLLSKMQSTSVHNVKDTLCI